ncbi:hypothetical protein ACHAW6_004407 [Cyclotella cf. meneghiniana]
MNMSQFFMMATREQQYMTTTMLPAQANAPPFSKGGKITKGSGAYHSPNPTAFYVILHHTAPTMCMTSHQRQIWCTNSMQHWVFQLKAHSCLQSAIAI